MSERFLVTGALGCIGAWVCRALADEGVPVVGYDLGENRSRLELVGAGETEVLRGDVTDRAALDLVVEEREITHVIHLAALLIPLIKANPPHGTAVNVVGTTNVLDIAKTRGTRVAWASSAAVFSDDDPSPVEHDADGHPKTFYGVHKQACEGIARIFWQEEGVPSIGLRPYVVYGPGRDAGLTASPSLAMMAAARGKDYEIAFGGVCQLQFAPDAARAFVAAARGAQEGAAVYNLGSPPVQMGDCATAIEAAAPGVRITVVDGVTLPFPEEYESVSLERALGPLRWTPLDEGVRATIDAYR